MFEFTQAIVTQGWLWASLLTLMLLFALDRKRPWPLMRSRLEIICATSLAIGLMFAGLLLVVVGSPITDMGAIDPLAFML
jgi:hypothetical protein